MGDFWFQYGLGVVAKIMFGALCGAAPLIYGAVKGQPRRGLIALLLCIVAGFFCGILAPFVAAYYVWRIYKSREDEVDDDMDESGLMSLNLNSKSVDKGVDKES